MYVMYKQVQYNLSVNLWQSRPENLFSGPCARDPDLYSTLLF